MFVDERVRQRFGGCALTTAAGNQKNVQQTSQKQAIHLPLTHACSVHSHTRLSRRDDVCERHVGEIQAWLLLKG